MRDDPERDPAAMMQSILISLPIDIYLLDRERKIRWTNRSPRPGTRKGNGLQGEGGYCYKEMFKRRTACPDCAASRSLATGRIEHAGITIKHKQALRHCLITAIPMTRGQGGEEQPCIIETVQDITEQKRTEEQLRRVSDFNAAIIDNSPVAIFTVDRSGKFMSVNPALAVLSGLGAEAEEKILGFNWLENPYTIRCGLAEHIRKGLEGQPFELQDFPFTTYYGDGGQYIHFRGVPLKGKDGRVEALLCIIEDTTEKVRAQIRSIQDAKMSVMGRLTTGVAHQLNNPLATVAGRCELASDLFKHFRSGGLTQAQMDELEESLEVAQEQAFRCKNIIEDMIGLTKKDGFEISEIDLQACLSRVIKLMNFEKSKVRLISEVASDIPRIRADFDAVKQCLMNILQNAVDAVEGREGAMIRLRANSSGKTVWVEIKDNGVGIDPNLLDKIYEPFFSTKRAGKGVGLGLTLCYDFLNRMGGTIEAESILGMGSTFKVTLPASLTLTAGTYDTDSRCR